ncbi:hypothetical protein [Candidatus Protochlamydia phocaeensis]|uniref:hypothetical protein n=1 Tax=Candidatus Protochlamydia phocaeensis TaxID=1414722 RepID=UPI0008381735|nr:hypothetical protein [Candidatus Protochlamydia phocaeensis]
MKSTVENIPWYLIIIQDLNGLPGKSIFDLIQLLLKAVKFEFVVLDNIYGAIIKPLVDKENVIIKLEDALIDIDKVFQFDWGDFFLFKEYPQSWNDPKGALYPHVIAQTDMTVRAVDDQYIYVYTPYRDLVDLIKNAYPTIESIKEDLLDNLEFPE